MPTLPLQQGVMLIIALYGSLHDFPHLLTMDHHAIHPTDTFRSGSVYVDIPLIYVDISVTYVNISVTYINISITYVDIPPI